MEKIFENIKFGDKFLTRDGRVAIYIGHAKDCYTYELIEEQFCFVAEKGDEWFNQKDIITDENGKNFGPCTLDIVSKYQEPIDEEKLSEFASVDTIEIANKGWDDEDGFTKSTLYRCCYDSYITGYRKAKEE